MRIERLGIAGALALVVSACGPSIDVSTDWDPAVNFSDFETFAVLDQAPGGSPLDGFADRRIKIAITRTLEAKGMRQVDDPKAADAAVGWQVTTDQRSSFRTVNTGWSGYGYRWGGWHGGGVGVSTSTTTETRYEVGTLVIALFDSKREEMIFSSTGSKKLSDQNLTPEESQARIDEAVATILESFPPGSTGSN